LQLDIAGGLVPFFVIFSQSTNQPVNQFFLFTLMFVSEWRVASGYTGTPQLHAE